MRLDPADRYESAQAMAAALLGEDAPEGDDVTAAIAAPATAALPPTDAESEAEVDGNETVRMPRMEETAHLPYQAPSPEPERPRRRPSKTTLIVAGAILALALITVFAVLAFTGPSTPPPDQGAGASSLPASLEDALTQLEESVQR